MARQDYSINLDSKLEPLESIDLADFASTITHPWFNQTLCRVNDSVVRLGIVEGEFHWHKHDEEDEFFYVVSGHLIIEVENAEAIGLHPGQGCLVPRGVVHRPLAPEKTVMLMFEGAGVRPTGD